MFIAILGRQPGISLAELEVLYGAPAVSRLSKHAALVEAETPNINTLGGSVKLVENAHHLEPKNHIELFELVTKYLMNHADANRDGKIIVGMSVYDDISMKSKEIKHYLIQTKKAMRSAGFSVRVVPNERPELNSAQVLHNKLTLEKNIELVVVENKQDNRFWIGKTAAVQNIEAYAARDQNRPKTDAKVGMLPPKLALTMINMTSSTSSETDTSNTVLDPFCGTGVVLQEALLLGNDVYGTDIEQRMIEFTRDNLEWLKAEKHISNYIELEQGDARTHQWEKPFDTVVSETYLGPPLVKSPSPNHLSTIRHEVNDLLKTFLENLAFQTDKGMTLCLGVPAWYVRGKYVHLQMLDDLEKLGYTRRVLKHVRPQELIYHRPDQIVARELLILERT